MKHGAQMTSVVLEMQGLGAKRENCSPWNLQNFPASH